VWGKRSPEVRRDGETRAREMLDEFPSRTAEAVCLMRAHEHVRPAGRRRVVDDPYAQWFLRPLARAALATERAAPDLARLAESATDGLLQFVLARQGFEVREVADASLLRRRYFDRATHLYPTNYVVHAVAGRRRASAEGS
jgi:hypothetical protein